MHELQKTTAPRLVAKALSKTYSLVAIQHLKLGVSNEVCVKAGDEFWSQIEPLLITFFATFTCALALRRLDTSAALMLALRGSGFVDVPNMINTSLECNRILKVAEVLPENEEPAAQSIRFCSFVILCFSIISAVMLIVYCLALEHEVESFSFILLLCFGCLCSWVCCLLSVWAYDLER